MSHCVNCNTLRNPSLGFVGRLTYQNVNLSGWACSNACWSAYCDARMKEIDARQPKPRVMMFGPNDLAIMRRLNPAMAEQMERLASEFKPNPSLFQGEDE